MQQSSQMIPMVPSFPPTSITTEQIQKYLDENKKLIVAILENQNFGKLAECAQYQAVLQKNLMYLAAIADAQPQPPVAAPTPGAMMTPKAMAPHPLAIQQPPPIYFMQQHQQAMQFGTLHQLQDPHEQAMQGHMGIRQMMGFNNNGGLQNSMMQHPETALGTNNVDPNDARGGGKQSGTDVSQSGADGQGGSAARHEGK